MGETTACICNLNVLMIVHHHICLPSLPTESVHSHLKMPCASDTCRYRECTILNELPLNLRNELTVLIVHIQEAYF